jgi:ABC-type transport system substrate-binding protein
MRRRLTLSARDGPRRVGAADFRSRAPGRSASAATEARKGGTLRMSAFSDVDFVDPALADAAGFFVRILSPGGANNGVHFDYARVHAQMAEAGRLTGEARRKAWADLDVNLMQNDPPYAPFVHVQERAFVSRRVGCYFDHPVYGFDIAAACKK